MVEIAVSSGSLLDIVGCADPDGVASLTVTLECDLSRDSER